MELGEAVERFRKEHGYSLREFAKRTGLSHVQIMRIEKGIGPGGNAFEPSVKTLKKLAAGMGISLNEIFAYCENIVIHYEKDDLAVSPEKQELIDRITNASPEQISKIKSIVDLVLES